MQAAYNCPMPLSPHSCLTPSVSVSQSLSEALTKVHARIAQATHLAERTTQTVQLIAVSKTISADVIAMAYAAGQLYFGENYAQEGIKKIQSLSKIRDRLVWHFIGPVQSNKTAMIAEHFDWVHSIDRLKVAQRLSAQRLSQLPPLQVCIQVNISGEASKSGIAPVELCPLAMQIAALKNIRLRGLMTLPEADNVYQRTAFSKLRELYNECNQFLSTQGIPPMDTLSMGMSADFEDAIMEGATMVRVGSAIFGPRAPLPQSSPT